MSDDDNTEEVQETKTEQKPIEEWTKEDLLAYARSQGKDAAKYRTKAKELETEVGRLKPLELEKLSEVDRLKAEKEALLNELRPYKDRESAVEVAKAAGLDEKYAGLIKGADDKERAEHAKALAIAFPKVTEEDDKDKPGKAKSGSEFFVAGASGKAPISGGDDDNFFQRLMAGEFNTN